MDLSRNLWYFSVINLLYSLSIEINYLVKRFHYEWLLTMGRMDTQLFCLFVFKCGACFLSGGMKCKLRLVFHELGLVAHDLAASTYTLRLLVSELALFNSCGTELCLLCDLSVSINGFQNIRYRLPQKPF